MFRVPNQYRIRAGSLGSDNSDGNNGFFVVTFESYELRCIASDGEGFEHVSVSMPKRTPSWKQMCFIKDMFWDASDCVMQLHPPEEVYINNHENCLHLWRPIGKPIPQPDKSLVGFQRFSGDKSVVPFLMRHK